MNSCFWLLFPFICRQAGDSPYREVFSFSVRPVTLGWYPAPGFQASQSVWGCRIIFKDTSQGFSFFKLQILKVIWIINTSWYNISQHLHTFVLLLHYILQIKYLLCSLCIGTGFCLTFLLTAVCIWVWWVWRALVLSVSKQEALCVCGLPVMCWKPVLGASGR